MIKTKKVVAIFSQVLWKHFVFGVFCCEYGGLNVEDTKVPYNKKKLFIYFEDGR